MNSDRHEEQVYLDEKAQNEPYIPISRWELLTDRYLSNIIRRLRALWKTRAPF